MAKFEAKGSVRVDLVGGTLDLIPINLILKDVVTINMATSLFAQVAISFDTSLDKNIKIISQDYATEESFNWEQAKKYQGPLKLALEILLFFKQDIEKLKTKLRIELKSDAPAGSGLGGSSAMGVTLYKALCEALKLDFQRIKAISIVNGLEAKILNKGPAGYQDYYPAVFGGVLALRPSPGQVLVEQFYNSEFFDEFMKRVTLVFSGVSRNSGINNWEVYKAFFDQEAGVKNGLAKIAEISHRAYECLVKKDLEGLLSAISEEGEAREQLFANIVAPEVSDLINDIRLSFSNVGLKVCGAGGGGCFLLVHNEEDKDEISSIVQNHNMKVMNFTIERPLHT